ncbi:SNF2 family N-terminal domain-containing protein [Camillea tinctor]|nr:SNF2 family N-terminal domain-containing protein [Camillea tinctor]
MGPSRRAVARRPKSVVQAEHAHVNDPFPKAFLEFLYALPADAAGTADASERPSKRARVAADVEPVVIARESLTLSRPTHLDISVASRDHPITLTNVDQYIKLRHDESAEILNVSSHAQSQNGAFKSHIPLDQSTFNNRLLAVLHVMNRSREDPANEGALWVATNLVLERDSDTDSMHFTFELNWNPAMHDLRSTAQRSLSQQVLNTFFTSLNGNHDNTAEKLQPQAFYEAAFMPDDSYSDIPPDAIVGLNSTLFPFQCRAVQWLLMREGMKVSTDDQDNRKPLQLVPYTSPSASDLPLSFRSFNDADGKVAYFSDLYHIVTKDVTPFQQWENGFKGGILAEEMGLGKTIEIISLILMHKRSSYPPTIVNPDTNQKIRPTGATLIVTPPSLWWQWLSEFKKHAPELHVTTYEGVKEISHSEAPEEEASRTLLELANCDVVITTYSVLQADIHFTESPPDRSMRYKKQYEPLKSPLTQLDWWRVCLDEAQQIESGVGNTAKVARLIPRVNAWAVTGTPVKHHIQDLWGLLLFFHYNPFASSTAIWNGLVTTHKELFQLLFNRIALRHTKRAVRDELDLPPQKRFVVTMPFTAIEESYYQEQFQILARSCGLDTNGNPLEENWDPDDPHIVDLMKQALVQLRKSVLHPQLGPQVGPNPRRLIGSNQPLRTIEEVLDTMIEQSDSLIRAEQRTYLLHKLRRGQVLENQPAISPKIAVDNAFNLWVEVQKDIKPVVEECRKQLAIETKKAEQDRGEERSEGGDSNDDDDEDQGSREFEDYSESKKESKKVGECRRKLRSALDVEHRAIFFIATAYYQKKSDEDTTKPGSDEFKRLEALETEHYELAKQIRKEILHEARTRASSHMKKLAAQAASQSFVEIAPIGRFDLYGLQSKATVERLDILTGYLDEQANLFDEWREEVIQLLLQPLVDEEAEADITGDEYEDSTKIQDELMAYTLALRTLLGDREDYVSGLKNERVRYETLHALRQAKNGEGHAPEKTLALLSQREKVKSPMQDLSLRAIIVELRELATNLRHDADRRSNRARVELDIVQRHLETVQKQITKQSQTIKALERELAQFTSAMNSRVEFYRQLQTISDTVAPLEVEGNSDEERNDFLWGQWESCLVQEKATDQRLTTAQAKHRYLLHLKDAGQKSNEPRICIICQSDITLGVLTVCGHQFCKACIMLWFKARHNCPMCQTRLTLAMLHNITLKKQELRLHQEQLQAPGNALSRNKPKESGIYTKFNDAKLDAINHVVLDGPSFATKIDTLIKHILWLREVEPGAKSIIFSQFKNFLFLVQNAFSTYRIGFKFLSSDGLGVEQFKQDPSVECLLMDARTQASGMNLVNANHVFICEPLLNTALELQAIARVHRIGQKHETTVWLYVVDGTVEESIYNLSVQRRLQHISDANKGKSKETTPEVSDLNLEAANSMELQQAALPQLMDRNPKLGENIDQSDLWECLFGHLSKDDSPAAVEDDERMNNPAVMGFLAAEAADERRRAQAEAEGEASGGA